MNKLVRFVVAAVLFVVPVSAADYLEPDDAFFKSYHDQVKSVFKEMYEPGVRVRMTVEPSFSVEYAVAVKQTGEKFAVISVTAENQLWRFEVLKQMKAGAISASDDKGNDTTAAEIKKLEASLPKNPNEVKVERCEVPLDAALAGRIIAVWRKMLAGVAAAPYDGGLDGTFYHFSAPVDGKELAGQTWSPSEDSNTGRLVMIAETARNYCQKRNPSDIATLQKQADELARILPP